MQRAVLGQSHSSGTVEHDQGVHIDLGRSAVLALHWQVNVIKPEGFFGPMLSEPVARSGVVERAVRFHELARAAGVPVVFTRFTRPCRCGSTGPEHRFHEGGRGCAGGVPA